MSEARRAGALDGQITYQGKLVGSFVMSVQDDLGYKKLVNHIAGVPIEEYFTGKPLIGRSRTRRAARRRAVR